MLSRALQKHNAPWCLTTSAHRLDARGAQSRFSWFLKRCCEQQRPVSRSIVKHFAFGKRVWTRYAPTARARAAICVQRFDDSLNPAIHITYRVSRRSSSLLEPRDPSLKGGFWFVFVCSKTIGGVGQKNVCVSTKYSHVFYSVCVFVL